MKCSLPLLSALLLGVVATSLRAQAPAASNDAAKIHPYTQQMTTEWLARLDKAEAVSKPGGSPEAAKPVMEELETFFAEKKQVLERHPDFKKPLLRQILLRIKLAKITAVSGLAAAEKGLSRQDPAFFNGKGGAYEQLAKADALVEAVASVVGKEQQAFTDLAAYVAQVRTKVGEKAAKVTVGGVAVVNTSGAKVHPFTQQTFETWLKNLEADQAVAAGSDPLEKKLKELEGGWSWYRSNEAELRKHPGYAQAAGRMQAQQLMLGELKVQKAVAFAQQGLKELNPNMFSESSGTYQQLKEAEGLQQTCAKAEGSDPAACAKLAQSITDARATVLKLTNDYKKIAAEKYRLPPERYSGGDKSDLKKRVLATWKELYPDDKVLGVRFHREDWERKKESNFNNGTWYHYDNSVLVVFVVVKTSADLATVYPAYVNKNNQSNALKIGADTKGNSYIQDDMLLKNVDL
ncbi:MAG: hypothetical protein JNN01_18940 [Opitutaceae bacterium]|nr:hypothetical protein [Opitutaceae bacterium]